MRHSVAAALLLASCSQTQIVTPRQTNGCAIASKGTEVTCDGKPFATIKTYFCSTEACPADALPPGAPRCSGRGLAVRDFFARYEYSIVEGTRRKVDDNEF